MRKTYKFSSCVCQGGYLYAHKLIDDKIKNKEGLNNVLNAIAKRFELIDVTIKIYDSIFFLFFITKPRVKPMELIRCIHNNISSFGIFIKEYLYTTVYDLQEEYIKKDLEKLGYNYENG